MTEMYTVRPDSYAAKWFTPSTRQAVIDWASGIPLPLDPDNDNYGAHMSLGGGTELIFDSVIHPELGTSISSPVWVVLAVRRSFDWHNMPNVHNDPSAFVLEPWEFDHVFNRVGS